MEADEIHAEFMKEFIRQVTIGVCIKATKDKQKCRTSPLTGQDYIDELLATGHQRRCFEVLRMERETFFALRDWLIVYTSLKPTRLLVEEKLAMFLHTVSRAASNRDVQERFQHSGSTVSE